MKQALLRESEIASLRELASRLVVEPEAFGAYPPWEAVKLSTLLRCLIDEADEAGAPSGPRRAR